MGSSESVPDVDEQEKIHKITNLDDLEAFHPRRFHGPRGYYGPRFAGPSVVVLPMNTPYPNLTSSIVPWGPQVPDTIRNAKFLDTTDGRKILTGISTSRNIFIKTTPVIYWSTEESLVKTADGSTYYYIE
jgi:hypothetical protein